MKIDVYHHDCGESETRKQLDRIERLLRRLVDEDGDRATAKELTAEVGATNTAIEAAIPAPPP